MFSEMLREMDKNTIKYMVDDMQEQIEKNKALIAENDAEIKRNKALIENLRREAQKLGACQNN